MINISVVVPTFRRLDDLARCLAGIDRQDVLPFEVIVICRDTDAESRNITLKWMNERASYRRRTITVSEPGVIVAMRAGTDAAEGDIVAYTDDDAVPRADWLKRIAGYYADPRVGGAGGRDVQEGVPASTGNPTVGLMTWYGKLIGNHHIGTGTAREVDVLKGVNMSFRKELVEFPDGLMGGGAQVHFEVHLCLRIRKLGYKLIYDPDMVVDHYPAQRYDADQRNRIVTEAIGHAAYNLHLGILNWGGAPRAFLRIAYALTVGDRNAPGIARYAAALLRREKDVMKCFMPGQRGHWQSLLRRIRQGPPPVRFRSFSPEERRNA